jgi:hypothetical protein
MEMLLQMYVNRHIYKPTRFHVKVKPSLTFLDKLRKIFSENASIGSRVDPCRQTDEWSDKHDEVNSRCSQFWEYALMEFVTYVPFVFTQIQLMYLTDL